ncbi:MAG: TSUP family transporter, partial [Acinetobacter bohemicus]
IVPALRKVTDLDMRSIVATSLMIIFLIGGVSISAHVLDGFQYPILTTFTFVVACIVGMLIGRSLIHQIDANRVQKIFATTVIGVALYLIYTAVIA